MTNNITPLSVAVQASDSSTSLLATTMILSLASIGYMYYHMKKQMESLVVTKKDIDEKEALEENVFQSWSGTFADGSNSLIATIVWKKHHSKGKNDKWIDWDGVEDDAVVNRNFYLGNESPSFDWSLEQRDFDMKATVKETFTDGWNSLVQMKITAFVIEPKTSQEMNAFLKDLVQANRIEWQKTVIDKDEFTEIFC